MFIREREKLVTARLLTGMIGVGEICFTPFSFFAWFDIRVFFPFQGVVPPVG